MFIRQHVGAIAVNLTLCFAVTVLSSATAHCAEQQADLAPSELGQEPWVWLVLTDHYSASLPNRLATARAGSRGTSTPTVPSGTSMISTLAGSLPSK